MSNTYTEIATRLAQLRPAVQIADHIGDAKKLKVFATVLDGITFPPKSAPKLLAALREAKDSLGNKAFAEASINNEQHWALKLSFAATNGVGFRETWRFPPLSGRAVSDARSDSYARRSSQGFSAHFGDSPTLPEMSSLHCAVAPEVCNIHIDKTGFVLEGLNGNISLTPDFFQHLVNELLFKTNLKGLAPRWANGGFDRVSLVYPNSANDFSRMGPRIGQVPLLREVGRIPGLGPVLSRVPLPGVNIDFVQAKTYKLTATASCGISGNCSVGMSFGGTHDLFGSR
jgi:hypothetical protein